MAPPRILSVSELAAAIRGRLETGFPTLWVAGELSNVRPAASGHLYFTLKDARSQLAAVMFRTAVQVLPFRPADGMEVVVRGRPSIYPARGTLQLYADALEPRGLGMLRLAFEQLSARLAAEGLFAAERKRPLPRFPRTIGVVTAITGAAVHDIHTVLRRRWPLARVLVRPVRVQGDGASRDIASGIDDLNQIADVDVLIVGRGGGSLEDLWAFNHELVARAIAGSRVPVVSAVGHEIDVTIADLVADMRAPTPSAAAAMVVPDRHEIATQLATCRAALAAALVRRNRRERERLDGLRRGLGNPRRRVDELLLRVDDLAARARRGLVRQTAWDRRELGTLARRLAAAGPAMQLARTAERVDGLRDRLRLAHRARLDAARAALARARSGLGALSPLAVLERGYAIVRRGDAAGAVVQDAETLHAGDPVAIVLARGRAFGRIERTES